MAKNRVFTKGCGLAVVLWLLMVGAYGYVAWQKIRQPAPAAIVGVLGGTFAAMLLSSIAGLFTGGRDRAALRRAANGEARRDGRLEAASGPVRALDRPLEAPFTGQPCVAYDYDVRRAVQGQSDFAGVAMTPCIVDAPRGPARILGWTMLDAFPAAPDERIDRSRGTRYLSTAAFEPLGVASILSTFSELVSDDDGTIRKDFRIGADSVDLTGRAIQERALPVGTVVTILGRWSESRQGFVAAGTASINRLFPGDLERTRKAVGGNAVKTVATAAFFFLALHAILVPMYMLAPQSGTARGRTGGSVWDERDCERQKAMLADGADPNERGTDALTPLMNAARLGEPDCVRNLIAAGAQLEARDKFSDTAITHAVVAGRTDNVAILLAAGAADFRVTAATGRPIPEDGAPLDAVRNYVEAVHQGDFETMARLMAHSSRRRLEDDRANLPLWQSIRPQLFIVEKENAWMTADAATLTIRGTTPSGRQRVTYHLERRADGWQIRKEWFPDR